jgi:predicted nuclease of restriction endonuclease-like RecB superfamily
LIAKKKQMFPTLICGRGRLQISMQVPKFLLSSMTKEVLSQVTACKMSNETSKVIKGNFTLAKRACTVNSRIALPPPRKRSFVWWSMSAIYGSWEMK